MKKLVFMILAFSLLLSACGAVATEETPPPLTGEDVQETAVAMAWTMAAETIAAMPTETFTPLPPTATPTFTSVPSTPTLAVTNTPIPSATPEKDACNKPLSGWSGTESRILVVNETKQTAIISIFLYQSARGYCGYLSATLTKNQSVSFAVPVGFYSASAWTAAGEQPTYSHYRDLGGVLNPDKHTLIITENKIKYLGP